MLQFLRTSNGYAVPGYQVAAHGNKIAVGCADFHSDSLNFLFLVDAHDERAIFTKNDRITRYG